MLESIRYVDVVFAEQSWQQKLDDIREYRADVFVMGSDWKGKFDHLSCCCEVTYLPRTPDISTTEIRGSLDPDRKSSSSDSREK